MKIRRVGIIGAGMMGSGIAQVCAQTGLQVILMDNNPSAIEKARKQIAWSVGKFAEKGKIKENRDMVLSRITDTTK